MKMMNILEGVELQECCASHCRDWQETLAGTITASNHAPTCEYYEPADAFCVREKGTKGPSCIFATREAALDMMDGDECHDEDGGEYEIHVIKATADQLNRLPEFDGF